MATMSDWASLVTDPPGLVRGWQDYTTVTQPAAAANAGHQVPGQYAERLIGVRAQLTTSATSGNRYIDVAVADEKYDTWDATPLGGPQAASLTWTYYGHEANGGYPFQQGTASYGQVPGVLVRPGWWIFVRIIGAHAGDQLSGVRLLLQRYPSDTTQISPAG